MLTIGIKETLWRWKMRGEISSQDADYVGRLHPGQIGPIVFDTPFRYYTRIRQGATARPSMIVNNSSITA